MQSLLFALKEYAQPTAEDLSSFTINFEDFPVYFLYKLHSGH